MKFTGIGKGIVAVTVLVIAAQLTVVGLIGYAIWHFVTKYW